MKLNTVNVIEYFSGTIQVIHSFSDDAEGNKQAEELFRHFARDNESSDEDIEGGLDDGYLEHSGGDYQVFIVHSSDVEEK